VSPASACSGYGFGYAAFASVVAVAAEDFRFGSFNCFAYYLRYGKVSFIARVWNSCFIYVQ
jgi:hypothetical protein